VCLVPPLQLLIRLHLDEIELCAQERFVWNDLLVAHLAVNNAVGFCVGVGGVRLRWLELVCLAVLWICLICKPGQEVLLWLLALRIDLRRLEFLGGLGLLARVLDGTVDLVNPVVSELDVPVDIQALVAVRLVAPLVSRGEAKIKLLVLLLLCSSLW
jgi:hypothetical protein